MKEIDLNDHLEKSSTQDEIREIVAKIKFRDQLTSHSIAQEIGVTDNVVYYFLGKRNRVGMVSIIKFYQFIRRRGYKLEIEI